MTTTKNNEHKKLNFSSEREQSQACLNSAEHEKNQGRKVLNVPNKREQNQTCLDSAEREGLRPKGNVPNLRFPEFQGKWDKCKFRDVCSISTGNKNTQDKIDDGIYPFYVRSQTVERINSWTFDGEAILTAGDGVGVGKVFHHTYGKIGVHQRVYILSDFKCDANYLFHFFSSKFYNRVKRMSAKNSVDSVRKEMITDMPLSLPSHQEQVKIGYLLSLLDERIATQSKIIEDLKKLKSAISKKLLCNDKWTTCIIQDIAEIGRGRVISSVEIDRQKHPLYPVYSSQTSNNGIMGYLDNYMFDGEYITWTTDGANAGTVFYRKGKFNCTNVCGTLKILPKFDCYFVSLVLQQATQKYVSSNLANPKLMNNTMASIKIRMPNIETQKQLSKVFQTLDSCLLVHQRTCKMYLSEKQYLLRQMFI